MFVLAVVLMAFGTFLLASVVYRHTDKREPRWRDLVFALVGTLMIIVGSLLL
jgi:heme/copper-type cytochrome/quinol oxidase subunit 4